MDIHATRIDRVNVRNEVEVRSLCFLIRTQSSVLVCTNNTYTIKRIYVNSERSENRKISLSNI